MCPELTSELNRPYLPVVGGQVVADVTVEPGVQTGSVTRQIALVIDTSGSMSGAKMERARNGAKFVLGYLDDDDVLCIVDFDSSAEVVLEADRFGNLGRERATERIDEMTAGGGTNIYEALEKAADELRAQPTGSDVARRILLLSDGKDNRRGPDDFDRQARDIDEHGVRIRAAGIGDEYDEETIRTLGTAARGQWRHIEEPDEIQEFFGEAVEQASTVVGTDAELRMDIAEGVEFTEAYRGAPQAQRTDVEYVGDNTGVVKLPDLLDRQTQTVQLKIQAPAGELGQTKTLADLTLHAGGETASGAIEVEYTDDDEKLSVENKDPAIAMDKTRIRTTLGRGEDDEAEKQVTKLREKHGEEAAADADRMEDEVTRVREGERGEQESATRIRDEEDRFD